MADIVWHNSSTNETQIWVMSGVPDKHIERRATVVDEKNSPIFVGPPWSIVGTANQCIVWHNSSSNETQLWFMSGPKILRRATVVDENNSPIFVGPPWSIVGVHTRFGIVIVWHNSSSNETQLWFISGPKILRRATVVDENNRPMFVGLPWSIVAVGDLPNGIVWHNSSTNETKIWFVDPFRSNDNTIGRRATVVDENSNPIFVGLPWSIVGASEREIIWYNSATNETQIWSMNFNQIQRRATVIDENKRPIFVGPPWSIVGAGNFPEP